MLSMNGGWASHSQNLQEKTQCYQQMKVGHLIPKTFKRRLNSINEIESWVSYTQSLEERINTINEDEGLASCIPNLQGRAQLVEKMKVGDRVPNTPRNDSAS
ncbi:uncharacterized protein G2W53_015406 [Senna tora]|uniref:Uncharacterized protein n=1 Tax=Senna tora TaxID=362788 RepID=A0A834WVF6_9FABA|nr:uncharacterized protein G2W53_015406 [Senna tora]